MNIRFGLTVLVSILVAGTSAAALAGTEAPPAATEVQAARVDRVFEMRTYTSHPGRLDDVVRRFQDHTAGLFEKQIGRASCRERV